jgi:hypothetical protein
MRSFSFEFLSKVHQKIQLRGRPAADAGVLRSFTQVLASERGSFKSAAVPLLIAPPF